MFKLKTLKLNFKNYILYVFLCNFFKVILITYY